ncbi:Immunoglobulin V-set domain, partial [Trinorchestia longiramus]
IRLSKPRQLINEQGPLTSKSRRKAWKNGSDPLTRQRRIRRSVKGLMEFSFSKEHPSVVPDIDMDHERDKTQKWSLLVRERSKGKHHQRGSRKSRHKRKHNQNLSSHVLFDKVFIQQSDDNVELSSSTERNESQKEFVKKVSSFNCDSKRCQYPENSLTKASFTSTKKYLNSVFSDGSENFVHPSREAKERFHDWLYPNSSSTTSTSRPPYYHYNDYQFRSGGQDPLYIPQRLSYRPADHEVGGHQYEQKFDRHDHQSGVRVIAVDVPPYVSRGDDVQLDCHYDLAHLQLYSLKWYRDDDEFFRYMPSEDPAQVVLPVPGVRVESRNSTGATVLLRAVSRETSGHYKCEVLSDAPEYYTADRSAPLQVVEIPDEEPEIFGAQNRYRVGEEVRLVCRSAKSRPPATITWYINDWKVPPAMLTQLPPEVDSEGLQWTKVALKAVVGPQHFVKGRMLIRCTARIPALSSRTKKHIAEGHLSYNIPVMQARDSGARASG